MQKVKNLWGKIKSWSLTKKIIYGIIIIALAFSGYMIFKPKDNSANITTDTAKIINLKQTILATGQVTSNTDLNLSFFSSGIVRSLKVKVGDEVKTGQVLATLDQANELASLTQARGSVAAAKAKYQRILDGASSEELQLARIALENAKLDPIDALRYE
jgi:multidrug efflux pump subunit AcrA (membrane-fusion protein)